MEWPRMAGIISRPLSTELDMQVLKRIQAASLMFGNAGLSKKYKTEVQYRHLHMTYRLL